MNARAQTAAVLAVVLVAAFAVTGFVTPGFFLQRDTAVMPGSASTGGQPLSGPEQFAEKVVGAFQTHDSAEVAGLLCPAVTYPNRVAADALVAEQVTFTLVRPLKQLGDRYYDATVTFNDEGQPFEGFSALLAGSGEDWCVDGVRHQAEYTAAQLDAAVVAITPMVDGINAGDSSSALAVKCGALSDADVGTVMHYADGKSALAAKALPGIGDVVYDDSGNSVGMTIPVTVDGSYDGAPVTNRASVRVGDGQDCVASFSVARG
ncbi:hypothetical protein SAMN05421504_102675 [Amycolatopsis xylanica]|uniref:Uncharacterized protein n=1 Tax=Amycolatopsis xylanica TaxID=589385 RepID=A0A1H2ZW73_9PSEU|nr:hypothetical protein [Amycolatopsis xylanica]SDX21138.1 hypothetical protein SAMN05421504_102675 [Amycolatopsis xylanica]